MKGKRKQPRPRTRRLVDDASYGRVAKADSYSLSTN